MKKYLVPTMTPHKLKVGRLMQGSADTEPVKSKVRETDIEDFNNVNVW